MTRRICETATAFADGECHIDCVSTPGAPQFIATYADEARTADGLFSLLEQHQQRYDAFVIACHGDPNLDAAKQLSTKPVVGIGEASVKIASMLGHAFSILTPVDSIIPWKEDQVRKYHLEHQLASVRVPEAPDGLSLDESLLDAARTAVEQDMAEVIILGCAAYAGYERSISERLGVPVLDGVICAVIIAAGLAKYGVTVSKVRKYR